VSANVPTRQTRSGELSMWKGCATAASARAAFSSALLAAVGMSGPTAAFEGRHGVWDQLTGPFELKQPRAATESDSASNARTSSSFRPNIIRRRPLAMALDLRGKVRVADIEAINVETYHSPTARSAASRRNGIRKRARPPTTASRICWRLGSSDGFVKGRQLFARSACATRRCAQLMQRIRSRGELRSFTQQFPGKLVTANRGADA
jgi:2-methylcitrate dehydratase